MTRYVVQPAAACATIEGGAVVLHMGTRRYYSLNESGTVIWQLLEEGAAEHQMIDRLVELYETTSVTAGASVARLIAELLAEDLVAEVIG